MVENPYEKSLTRVDNNIFGKIKKFLKNLFRSDLQAKAVSENIIKEQEENNIIEDRSFINNVKIQENKQNLKLTKLSKDLETGKIIEEDLCEQELQELRNFYLQQIEEKKQIIENYKNRIVKIKTQLT